MGEAVEVVNPDGIYRKYLVAKINGESIDPDADYFILRLDGGDQYATASRKAALKFADAVEDANPSLANDLRDKVFEYEKPDSAPIVSSNILEARGHLPAKILEVTFKGGTKYRYYGLHRGVQIDFFKAESKGSFLARKIKGNYTYRKV